MRSNQEDHVQVTAYTAKSKQGTPERKEEDLDTLLVYATLGATLTHLVLPRKLEAPSENKTTNSIRFCKKLSRQSLIDLIPKS